MEDLLAEAEWLNVPNRWRLGLIRAMDRILKAKFPEPIWDLIANAPRHQYETRTTGMRMAWTPRNETVARAMFWQAKEVFNKTRYDHMPKAGLTKTEHTAMAKNLLIGCYGNTNV